jgi:hypothetical protein
LIEGLTEQSSSEAVTVLTFMTGATGVTRRFKGAGLFLIEQTPGCTTFEWNSETIVKMQLSYWLLLKGNWREHSRVKIID